MKNIVILGAGFGGLTAALELEKQLRNNKDTSITLVDKRDFHLYAPNLYEIAAAEEELTTVRQLKKSIALPFSEVFKGKKINFVQGEIKEIDYAKNAVSAGGRTLSYDYLVVALGSVTDFFGIEGAEKFALPLKSLSDGLRLRNQVEFAIQQHRADANKKNIRLVVAGGGYTGCELAGELSEEIKFLAWKNNYPPEKIEVAVVEAQSQLIPGFSQRLSRDAYGRLKELGVDIRLSSPIFKVDEHFVELVTQEKLEYDVLVWTTGVKACRLPLAANLELDKKGRLLVNGLLQINGHNNIFAVGDSACVMGPGGRPAPPTAQDAIDQGKFLAQVIPALMQNTKPAPYGSKKHGFIVSLGGRWAILDYAPFYFSGWFAYLFHELAAWDYYRQVVGWWKALKYILLQMEIYGREDA